MSDALYPGSFDPVTLGHLDLIARGAALFSRLVVAVADNPRKRAVFTAEERVAMLRRHTKRHRNVEVASFSGLVVDYAKAHRLDVLLRGVRTTSDFEFEYQMALTNRSLAPGVETVFMMPSAEYAFLSSTLIKEVVGSGGDASRWVPKDVERALAKRLARGSGL
jgi:pantetheine-phosphate adenylyltransferase